MAPPRLLRLAPLGLLLAAEPAEPPPIRRDLPGDVMPDRSWDFRELRLEIRLDPRARTVEGIARHVISPLGAPDRWVRLHQVGLSIDAVTVDGAPVADFRIGRETLDIPVSPAGAGKPGDRVIEVKYHAKPQLGLHFRGGDGSGEIVEAWSQGEDTDNRYWFPGWDYPNDRFRFSARITAPSDLAVRSVGALRSSSPDGDGWTAWEFGLDREIPNYLVAVVAGDYATYNQENTAEEGAAVPLEFLAPPGIPEAAVRRTFGDTGDMMAYFAETFDEPFPWPVYRQVLVQRFLYGAMENPTLVPMELTYLREDGQRRDDGAENVVAHELAHQWFGDLLTAYGWRELWVNEGFAEYWAGRWFEHRYGPEQAALVADGWHQVAHYDTSPLAPKGWTKQEGRDHGAVYGRGASVLHLLRSYLGEEVFLAAIRRYLDEYAGRFVETEQLRRVFEEVSGKHLGWLFDSYVHQGGIPKFSVSHAWNEGQLEVRVEQRTEGAPFSVPVSVQIGTRTGEITRPIWLTGAEAVLSIPMDDPPGWVAVDPEGGALADWEVTQEAAEWIAQLVRSPSAPARLAAMRAIPGASAGEAGIQALSEVARDTARPPAWRAEAARQLGACGAEGAEELSRLLDDPEIQVRVAALAALGGLPRDPARTAQILARYRGDPDAEARGAALKALPPKEGLPLARKAVRAPEPTLDQPLRLAAIQALGAKGVDADVDLLLPLFSATNPRRIRREAAGAAIRILDRMGGDDREDHRWEVSEPLVLWLSDPDLRSRQAGVRYLGEVGDDDAERALRSLAGSTTIPALATAAQDAASRIRSRKPEVQEDTGEAGPGKADAARLNERIDDLTERIEELELLR